MTIFVILMPSPMPMLADRIKAVFPNDSLSLNETQWLVSTTGTVIELTARLGIYDAKDPTAHPTGAAVIFSTSSYYGRAPSTIWDWVKAKLETATGV